MNWRKKVSSEEEKKEILSLANALQKEAVISMPVIQSEPEKVVSVSKEQSGGLYRPPMASSIEPVSEDKGKELLKPSKPPKKESCNIQSNRDFPTLGGSGKGKKKKAMQVDVPSMKESDDMEISKPSWIEIAKKGEVEEKIRKELEMIQKEEQEKAKADSKNEEYNSVSEYMDIVNREHAEYTGYGNVLEDFGVEHPEYIWDESY